MCSILFFPGFHSLLFLEGRSPCDLFFAPVSMLLWKVGFGGEHVVQSKFFYNHLVLVCAGE